jgi:hypothetical protein
MVNNTVKCSQIRNRTQSILDGLPVDPTAGPEDGSCAIADPDLHGGMDKLCNMAYWHLPGPGRR